MNEAGKNIAPVHGAIHIAGSDTEGALRIQVMAETIIVDGKPQMGDYILDVFDMGKDAPLPGADSKFSDIRFLYQTGTTSLSNTEIIDVNNNGKGVLKNVWTDPNGPFRARYLPGESSCMPFVRAVLAPNGPLGPNIISNGEYDMWWDKYKNGLHTWAYQYSLATKEWSNAYAEEKDVSIRLKVSNGRGKPSSVTEFPIKTDDLVAIQPKKTSESDSSKDVKDPCGRIRDALRSILLPWDEVTYNTNAMKTEGGQLVTESERVGSKETMVVKNKGVGIKVSVIGKAAAGALGIAGVALDAVFVILDFVDKKWVGAALGLAVSGTRTMNVDLLTSV